jgi:hypothetical protein
LAANNVLSQGDIDALLAGAPPSLEAPSDSGPSAPVEETSVADIGGVSPEELDALSAKVASLESALGKLEQLDAIVARIERLESTVQQLQLQNTNNLQKLQIQMMQRLNAVVDLVKQSRGAAPSPQGQPQRRPPQGRPSQGRPGQPQRRMVRR